MLDLLRAGGAPALFVLVLSLATLVAAARMVVDKNAERIATVKALTVATVLAVAAGIIANISVAIFTVTARASTASSADALLMLMQGIGESLAPGSIGLSALAVAWMLVSLNAPRVSQPMVVPAATVTALSEAQADEAATPPARTALRKLQIAAVFIVGAINLIAAVASVVSLFQ